MPIDALLLSLAVCGVFLIFAAVLAWIDHRTTRWQHRASEKHTVAATEPTRRKAA